MISAKIRLIGSLSRFITPEDAQDVAASGQNLKFESSKPAGGAFLLKGLWNRIGIDKCLSQALKDRSFTTPVADAVFAMVANRALAPRSKLAVEKWTSKDVHLDIEEPLRGPHLNEEALNRGGRFKVTKENLHIKEVYVREDYGRRRFVVAYNPEQAEHDKYVRERNLERISAELEAMSKMSKKIFLKAKYALLAHWSMGRYLKELKSGKLKVDKAKVRQYEKLDGKYLLSTSDKSLACRRCGSWL